MVSMEFDPVKGYTALTNKKTMSKDDYLDMPVIRWCHDRVGSLNWPKDINQTLTGDGWEIYADWQEYLGGQVDKPRTYVIINKQVDTRLFTEFWMRFGT